MIQSTFAGKSRKLTSEYRSINKKSITLSQKGLHGPPPSKEVPFVIFYHWTLCTSLRAPATVCTIYFVFYLFIIWISREGNGTPLQYSCLENPLDGGAWWAAVHGVTKSRTRLSDVTFTFHFHALEKEMATHSGVLAWRIPGTGEPGGLPSMGSHRVRHYWSDLAAVAAAMWISH